MFVNRANPMLEAGVKISTLPVGVGVDSSLRMLAWGWRRSNPGGSRPSLHPPFVPSGGVRTNIIRLKRVSNCYIQEKNLSVCVDVRLILVLVWKTLILVLVWGTDYVPATHVPGISRQTTVWYQVRTYNIGLHPKTKNKNTSYQRALRCQLRGPPLHPWAGRPRFSGEAHPGPAT